MMLIQISMLNVRNFIHNVEIASGHQTFVSDRFINFFLYIKLFWQIKNFSCQFRTVLINLTNFKAAAFLCVCSLDSFTLDAKWQMTPYWPYHVYVQAPFPLNSFLNTHNYYWHTAFVSHSIKLMNVSLSWFFYSQFASSFFFVFSVQQHEK